jgi:hypothetical protein
LLYCFHNRANLPSLAKLDGDVVYRKTWVPCMFASITSLACLQARHVLQPDVIALLYSVLNTDHVNTTLLPCNAAQQ